MMHWPVGTVHYLFKPEGSGRDYVTSPILKPFEDAGLREDMIVLYGMDSNVGSGQGGGHEAGTPMATTGASCPGTRSMVERKTMPRRVDRRSIKSSSNMSRRYKGRVSATLTRFVTRGSIRWRRRLSAFRTATRRVRLPRLVAEAGGQITENVPLLPELSPAQLYMQLFSEFMPGGSTSSNQEAAAKALVYRKSVLDYSLNELGADQRFGAAK